MGGSRPATRPTSRQRAPSRQMATASPVVDVGIRTFGRPPHLAHAIESVLAQTQDGWRLVISEDGASGAGLRPGLDEYLADARVQFVQQPRSLGAAGNSNALVELGSAPLVAILHHDDCWNPGFLERRVAFLRKHPEEGFAFGGSMLIDDAGNEEGRTTPALTPGCHSLRDYVPLLLERHAVPLPCGCPRGRARASAVALRSRQRRTQQRGRHASGAPRALLNPRLAAVLLTFLLGARGRPALTRARTIVRRRNYLRTHLRPCTP